MDGIKQRVWRDNETYRNIYVNADDKSPDFGKVFIPRSEVREAVNTGFTLVATAVVLSQPERGSQYLGVVVGGVFGQAVYEIQESAAGRPMTQQGIEEARGADASTAGRMLRPPSQQRLIWRTM